MQNFKPGGLARFGLDYESVRAGNRDVIYASISGFGAGGGKDLPGYDLMVQAMSGLMSLTGDPAGPPYRAGISVFDVITGLHTAIAILAALHHRTATGEGQHLEASLMASALSAMVNQTSAYVAGGVVPYRMGNSHPFATNEARTANREQLRPLLTERLAARPAAEWFAELNAAGVPCGPINTVDAGVDFARDIGLEPVVTAGDSGPGVPTIRHPVGYSATPPSYPLPPPAVDEHGDQIRAWLAEPHPAPPTPPRPAATRPAETSR